MTSDPAGSAISALRRRLQAAAGWACFALGAVGVVVPGLPTTVFWILAGALWMRSDPARLRWLLDNPRYGATIRCFLERGEIARRDKRLALLGIGVALCIWSLLMRPSLAALLALGALMACVSAWIWWRPEPEPARPGTGTAPPPEREACRASDGAGPPRGR